MLHVPRRANRWQQGTDEIASTVPVDMNRLGTGEKPACRLEHGIG
jgi:hypothetical protein